MNELFPIAGGLLVQPFASIVPHRLRMAVKIAVGMMVALAATWGSGEYQISWSYVWFDAFLVAAGAVSGSVIRKGIRAAVTTANSWFHPASAA